MITTRQAMVADTDVWRALRRDGIVHYPNAFMHTLDQHDANDPEHDRDSLAAGGRFIASEGDTPVGIIALNPHHGRAYCHRAEIGPLYVLPAFQGGDAAKLLILAAVEYAQKIGVWQLELSVNEANTRAVRFYLREGFAQYGRLPNVVVKSEGPEHDLLMLRILPHPS